MSCLWRSIWLAALSVVFIPAVALCDSTSPTPAPPTPAPPSTTVSAVDEFSPNYHGESGSSNIVNLRAQLPYDNSSWVVRLKLPIVTAAPPESVTGAGDLAIWDLKVINNGYGQWLIGGTFRFPTAHDSLGTNKYSLGPSAGYVVQRGQLKFGYFANSFFSVIGPSWVPGVAKTQIAPILKYDTAGGWNVDLSTMQFTYDWVRNRWTDIPLGFRIGKKPLIVNALDAYLEGEYNFAHTPDTPGWTIRALLRWKFSGPQNPASNEDDDQ